MNKNQSYSHMFDIAFTVISTKENYEDITEEEIIDALYARINQLKENKNEILSSIGFSDTIELD